MASLHDLHLYEEVGRSQHSVVYRGRNKHSIEFVAVKRVERAHSKRLPNQVRSMISADIATATSMIMTGAESIVEFATATATAKTMIGLFVSDAVVCDTV
jgi:hypothetical protein